MVNSSRVNTSRIIERANQRNSSIERVSRQLRQLQISSTIESTEEKDIYKA
jgi:hypothetical protein